MLARLFILDQDTQILFSYPVDASQSAIQYDRLTSSNHYYDYLYVGLFIKELETQWLKAGYDISQRPDVITTLYNIGMNHSLPKPNPGSWRVNYYFK